MTTPEATRRERGKTQVKVRLEAAALAALEAVCCARTEALGAKAGERGETLAALILAAARDMELVIPDGD